MNGDNKSKVVFQLSNNDTFVHKSFVRQLNNVLTAMQGITIEVVTHGYGIDFLLNESSFAPGIKALHEKGVSFLVCQNTLDHEKVDPGVLLPVVRTVPSGLAHVIARQDKGWSYIKVGF